MPMGKKLHLPQSQIVDNVQIVKKNERNSVNVRPLLMEALCVFLWIRRLGWSYFLPHPL